MFFSPDAAGIGKSQHVKFLKGSVVCSLSLSGIVEPPGVSVDCLSDDEQFRAVGDTNSIFRHLYPWLRILSMKEVTGNNTRMNLTAVNQSDVCQEYLCPERSVSLSVYVIQLCLC